MNFQDFDHFYHTLILSQTENIFGYSCFFSSKNPYLTQGGTCFEHQGHNMVTKLESDMLTTKQQQCTCTMQVQKLKIMNWHQKNAKN